jgi:D-alanyl-D-alanine carboxypeptidase (penicillin-binding protein 5/6)
MKRFLYFALLGLVMASHTVEAAPALPPAPQIEARAWLLLDAQSGATLAARDPDKAVEPASLTKIMTAYLVLDAIKQDKIRREASVSVSERAWQASGARMYLDTRRPVKIDDLLRGMLVQSANDACVALAEATGGDEARFVERMNSTAKRLGLSATRFVNACGQSAPQHRTTARDLASLTRALIRDFPKDYATYFANKEFSYAGIHQTNHNRLLWLDPNVDGVKTGQTASAGYCLIASTKRDNRRLISVVVGAASDSGRVTESQKLLNHGLQYYETVRLYTAKQPVAVYRIYKGLGSRLGVGFADDFYVTLPRGGASQLQADIIAKQPFMAPVARGDVVATLRLRLAGEPYAEYPLTALQDIPVASLFGRAWDGLMLLVR